MRTRREGVKKSEFFVDIITGRSPLNEPSWRHCVIAEVPNHTMKKEERPLWLKVRRFVAHNCIWISLINLVEIIVIAAIVSG